MNYGKLAYLRLDELESEIRASSETRIKNSSASYKSTFSLRDGNDYMLNTISGVGALTIIVTFDCTTTTSGKINLYVDDVLCSSTGTIAVGDSQKIITKSVRYSDMGQLKLVASDGYVGYVTSATVVAIGEDAFVTRTDYFLIADDSSTRTAVMKNTDTDIRVLQYYEESGSEKISEMFIGYGTYCDIAGDGEEGFYSVHCDLSANLWLSRISGNNVISSYRVVNGATHCAVTYHNATCIVIYYLDGKCYYVEVSKDLSTYSEPIEIKVTIDVDGLSFVKNAPVPIIVFNSGGKVFIKYALQEYTESFTLSATVTATVTEVS